jgi:hypothetical protein
MAGARPRLTKRGACQLCTMRVGNFLNSVKVRVWVCVGFVVLAVSIFSGRGLPAVYAGPVAAPESPVEKQSRSGAELYATHCSRCHQERFATEFTSAQWKTIMLHMRVRANLTAEDANEIVKYLRENSGQ